MNSILLWRDCKRSAFSLVMNSWSWRRTAQWLNWTTSRSTKLIASKVSLTGYCNLILGLIKRKHLKRRRCWSQPQESRPKDEQKKSNAWRSTSPHWKPNSKRFVAFLLLVNFRELLTQANNVLFFLDQRRSRRVSKGHRQCSRESNARSPALL